MDGDRFDRIAKTIRAHATRRSALALLSTAGLGSLLLSGDAGAKKKKKKKKKKCRCSVPCCANVGGRKAKFCPSANEFCCPAELGGGTCAIGETCCPPTPSAPTGFCLIGPGVCPTT